jgi:ribosome maturation factor RimP
MNIAHEKLPGLDRARVCAAVGPVLAAHRVECVELVWRTDRGGWLLEVTIERPDARLPGEGVTIDLCTDVSRDLSAALDVADCIPHHYTLEVGSPGVERGLYQRRDYERFAGQGARLKFKAPINSNYVVTGTLHGLDESGRVLIETERSELMNIELEQIDSARLIFEWKKAGASAADKGRERRTAGHGRHAPRPQRSR